MGSHSQAKSIIATVTAVMIFDYIFYAMTCDKMSAVEQTKYLSNAAAASRSGLGVARQRSENLKIATSPELSPTKPPTPSATLATNTKIVGGKHFFKYFDLKVCYPGYSGDECDRRMKVANPWYTQQCPNLQGDDTFDPHIVIDTKVFGKEGCNPPGNSMGLPLSYCASLCYSHPKYGIAVIPHFIWETAQKAEGSAWKGNPSNDDRSAEHITAFQSYKSGLPHDLGDVIEVGAGPWTQTRGMLDANNKLKVKSFTVYEPGADFYKRNTPSCAYKTGKLIKFHRAQGFHEFPVTVIGTGGESLLTWNKKYDTLVSINVIEHVENALEYLEGLWKVIKPGGLLIFHDRYCITPEKCDGALGRNLYHPIRISKFILDTFLSKFDMQFLNDKPNWGGRRVGEVGYYFIGRKK